MRVAFIGNVRYLGTLVSVIEASTKLGAEFHIYGDGPARNALERRFANTSTITFHGAYSYSDVSRIYADIDLVWAVYPSSEPNVKYAISNKFFESQLFGVPGVFAKGTALGELVREHEIGFVVDPESIQEAFVLLSSLRDDASRLLNARLCLGEYSKHQTLAWSHQEPALQNFIQHICGVF
ncbi:glycosyltransferase [Lacipirellula limnantheis]